MKADYVVVGAGSAGCVLADRLSESGASVILLEAGPRDQHPYIHIPAAILKLLRHPVLNWNYLTEPEAGTANRALEFPRGRVLGGSSSINGMLWVRGNRADFDRWAQMGALGWGYDDVLAYFRNIESYQPGDPELRGKTGPLRVEDYRTTLPITNRFVEAAQQSGIPFNPDLSGAAPAEGVGYSQMSRSGRFRQSTAQSFLKRAGQRRNLRIETDALATSLLFDDTRCIGVRFRHDGKVLQAMAEREVILSGGTINSPHLLQISGIGPSERLTGVGISVRHDLPGVGQNLSDHCVVRISWRIRDAITINQLARGWRLAREAVRFALLGDGALTFGVSSAQAYVRTRDGLAGPDIQLLFTPASYDRHRFGELEREPGMTVAVSLADPESRGEVMATSPDPLVYPALRPNYLATSRDLETLIEGVRIARRIFDAPAFAPYKVEELQPGADQTEPASIEAFIRQNCTTLYHIVGTCRMGEDPQAVVDSRLRVHGLDGLRVADASVMPTVTAGNTNATTVMIGEKAAAMILEDARR